MEEDKLNMENWIKKVPPIHWLYMRIAEPRVIRILYFMIYICMITAGVFLIQGPPHSYKDVVGLTLVYVLASFLSLGGLLAAIAVLPGIWWLERVGVILLGTAAGIYAVIVISLKGSPIPLAISIAILLVFFIRWIDIRKYQLAPTKVVLPREE